MTLSEAEELKSDPETTGKAPAQGEGQIVD